MSCLLSSHVLIHPHHCSLVRSNCPSFCALCIHTWPCSSIREHFRILCILLGIHRRRCSRKCSQFPSPTACSHAAIHPYDRVFSFLPRSEFSVLSHASSAPWYRVRSNSGSSCSLPASVVAVWQVLLSLSAFLHAASAPCSRVRSPSTAIILSPISLVTLAPRAGALSHLTTLASSAFEVRISATSALSHTLLCQHSRVWSHFDSFCSLRILAYHARTPLSHPTGAPVLACDAILAAFLARRSTVVFW